CLSDWSSDVCSSDLLAPETIDLKNREGKTLRIDLQEREGSAITWFMAHSGALEFCVKMAGCGDLLEVCRGARGENHTHQLLPSRSEERRVGKECRCG